MFANALLSLYRTATRHKLFAALNISGLAVGIAVFLTLFLDVSHEMSFDRWIPGADQVYVVQSTFHNASSGSHTTPSTSPAILDALKADYHGLIGARIMDVGSTVRQDGRVTSARITAADPDLTRVLQLPLAAGRWDGALSRPDSLVLTEGQAKAYFGTTRAVGRELTLVYQGETHVQRVTAVIRDLPTNTDFEFDLLVPFKEPTGQDQASWSMWDALRLETLVRLATPEEARALSQDLDRFTDRRASSDIDRPAHLHFSLSLLPLTDMHLRNPKDSAIVAGLAAVGVLTLVLAAMNYVNLSTARAALRAREVAMRKVLGASQWALTLQFLGEAVATTALAALIGLALCELALPAVNAAGGLSLKIGYVGQNGVLPPLISLVLLVGLGAGVYPALVLSRFQPAAVLASARSPGGGLTAARVREVLVVLQFTMAIAFSIVTALVVAQTRYLRHADVGFDRHGLIVVKAFEGDDLSPAQRTNLLAAWRALPGVEAVSVADIAPGVDDSTWTTSTKRPSQIGDGPDVQYNQADASFFSAFRPSLLAGRAPDPARGGDFTPQDAATGAAPGEARPSKVAVLNATAARRLGFPSPQAAVGATILQGRPGGAFNPITVIGVIADLRFRTPRAPVPPTAYLFTLSPITMGVATLRYAAPDPQKVIREVSSVWTHVAPDVPVWGVRTSEDYLDRYYRPDDRHGRLFTIGAILAVLIGCVGLYGLASFSTARRTKEIGIRKTLGASTFDVLRLLIGQFLRPVVLANLLAWPLAWVIGRNWLSGFDQHVAMTPVYFLAAAALTLVVATGTVAGQALRVARAEPARALRVD